MHSSRMRTARSSSRGGVSTRHPPEQVPPMSRHPPRSRQPPGQAPPGADTPPAGPGTHPRDHAPTPVDKHTPVNVLRNVTNKKDNRINDKHQGNFSFSLGVNGPCDDNPNNHVSNKPLGNHIYALKRIVFFALL